MWDFFTSLWAAACDTVSAAVGYVKDGAKIVADVAKTGWNYTRLCSVKSWEAVRETWKISKMRAILGAFLAGIGVGFIAIAAVAAVLIVAALVFVAIPVVLWKLIVICAYGLALLLGVSVILFVPIAVFFGGAYILLNLKDSISEKELDSCFNPMEATV